MGPRAWVVARQPARASWIRGSTAGMTVALAVLLAGCGGPPPHETDNYFFFTRTNTTIFDDEQVVYVADGRVRAVGISDEAATLEYYGYTPNTIAQHLEQTEPSLEPPDGYDADLTWANGVPTSICETWPEHETTCRDFWDVHTLTPSQAAEAWQWDVPTDGTFTATARSVTWENPATWKVTVVDGAITEAAFIAGDASWGPPTWQEITEPGSRDFYRVTYWNSPRRDLPLAVCYDEPNSYDEEYCWSLTRVE